MLTEQPVQQALVQVLGEFMLMHQQQIAPANLSLSILEAGRLVLLVYTELCQPEKLTDQNDPKLCPISELMDISMPIGIWEGSQSPTEITSLYLSVILQTGRSNSTAVCFISADAKCSSLNVAFITSCWKRDGV